MHVGKIVHDLLDGSIHKTRVKSLIPILKAVIASKQLNLTQLGRSLETNAKERSGIRRIDKLLSNSYYQNNSIDIYKAIIDTTAAKQGRPVILVDWSGLPNSKRTSEDGEHCLLRASLIAEGRSITLYEEVHSKKKENNALVHRGFLSKLQSILPTTCRPYIITDAGFKNPWFRAVLALKWDYIGRARGTVHYNDGTGFKTIKALFCKATNTPKSEGVFQLSKKKPLQTNFYLYTHSLKGKKKRTKSGKIDTHKDSINHGKSYREPWILVSSLTGYSAVKRVVRLYKMRMTIELAFRDIKSIEFGLSMNENKTIRAKRYTVWLILAALASLIAWIVGYAAEKQRLHYDFQANTYRHRRVLSFFYLGCQIIRKNVNLSFDVEEIQHEAWALFSWEALC